MFIQSSFVLLVSTALTPLAGARPIRYQLHRRQGDLVQSTQVSFGSCSTPKIIGAVGLDNRVEFAFQPADKVSYPHGSAQGIQIITQFICDTLVNACPGATTAAHDLCTATQAAVGAGKNDGGLADKFNAAFGLKTNFVAAPGSIPANGTPVPVASAKAPTSQTVGAATPKATSGSTTAAAPNGAISLGSCSNPEIEFANGLDGRTQPAFIAVNQSNFTMALHSTSLLSRSSHSFITQRLSSPCNANAAALAAAPKGAAAAQANGGTSGAAADAWNAAFGITTNFASVVA